MYYALGMADMYYALGMADMYYALWYGGYVLYPRYGGYVGMRTYKNLSTTKPLVCKQIIHSLLLVFTRHSILKFFIVIRF